ncbi:dCTP deaminase [Cytobacillus oceanisediminis]|uniref:dCTP deaminase n=1 Tax=Cytobacillus oceanisediminis TaxID=665099 RepID=UPI001C225C6F|nr:dCTP deaminase [Cytobacillus oceanisediminis]MBU8730491.1 dCTP deaminase [Cytobacillus oceanisediminis]
MILSGKEIEKNLGEEIIITPFVKEQLNPNSYNLRLHNELLIYNEHTLDMKKENKTSKIRIPEDGLILLPGKLYLGRTIEYTETKGYIPFIEGRSSVGRLGLSIHISSPYGNVGFKGYWTLEISCLQPIRIYPEINICQIYYQTIKGEFDSYSSFKYQNNKDIQSSKLFKEFE